MSTIGRGRANLKPAWMTQGGGSLPQTLPGGLLPPTTTTSHQQQANIQRLPVVPLQGVQPGMNISLLMTGGWIEAKTPEGRVYYSNTQTGETTFDKPEQLKTHVERQLPYSPWKEYVKDGKSYYVNSKTKESVWEEPMEFTTHRERVRALCAGEAPTRDMTSLALYQAAQRALDEMIVDVDGSFARKKKELEEQDAKRGEEDNTQQNDHANKFRAELQEISGELKRPSNNKILVQAADGKEKEIFLEMLNDWQVPINASWEEAFSCGIAADPRYTILPNLLTKKQLVMERRGATSTVNNKIDVEGEKLKKKQQFEEYLQELQARSILGPRSQFQSCLPILKYEKKTFGLLEIDLKTYFEIFVEQIRKKYFDEKEKMEANLESNVHEQLKRIDNHENLSPQQLYEKLVETNTVNNNGLKEFQIQKYCNTFSKKLLEAKEQEKKEKESREKDLLREGLIKAFSTGALSIDARWAEFRTDDHLRTDRAPWLMDLLMPFAGNETVVEKIFRSGRDEAKDLVSTVGRILREYGWNLSNIKKMSDITDVSILEELKKLEEKYGKGILEAAVYEQSRRFLKDKERFFELLSKYVRETRDGDWNKIQPIISDRTAYKEMISDVARKNAFDEYVSTLDSRKKRTNTRSRSPGARKRERR